MLKLFRYQELKLAKQETRICLTHSNFYTLIISLFVFLVTYPILNNLNTISCHSTRPKQYLTNTGNNKNHHASRQQRAVYMAIENQPTAAAAAATSTGTTRLNSSESLASSWFYQQDQPVILDQCCACDEAKYELVFEGLWSKYTHPDDFPENYWLAYFSDIIGASHSNDFRMWGQGVLASEGVRELAETGATKKLEFELKQVSSKTRTIIKARELRYPTLNSKTSAVFRTDKHHHLVSILSKLGPSPDWMVGVSGLELCQLDCTWAAQRIVNLYLWDAGTDSGSTFTSSDEPTRPQEPIHSYRRSSAAQLSSQTNATMRSMFDASNNNFDQVLSQFKNQQQQAPDQLAPLGDQMQTTQLGDAPFMVSSSSNSNNNNNANSNGNLGMDGFNSEYIKPFARLTVTRQRIYEKSCNGGDPISSYSSPSRPMTAFNQHSHHNQHQNHQQHQQQQQQQQQQHNLQSHYRQAMDTDLAYDPPPMKPPATASYSDCRFTDWTDWSSCSSTCGKGIRTRTRSHLDDQADLAGCSKADLIEKEVCLSECVANTTCVTRDWSEWSKCSLDCGQGYRKRTRSPIGQMKPACGSIELVETEQCTGSCGQDEQPASHCAVSEWSEWSECPVACGTGTKIRFRQFVRKEDAKNCNVKLIQKQSCTGRPELCNQVSKDRRQNQMAQTPNDQSYLYQGKINPDLPVIDCKLSTWSPWSTCSALCGNGRRTRSRYVIQMPQNGGKPCDKKLTRTQRCKDLPPCPQDYSKTIYHHQVTASDESYANKNNHNNHNNNQHHQQPHHNHRVSQTRNELHRTTTTTTTPSGSLMDDEDESKFSRLLKSDLGHLQLQTSWTPTESYISDGADTSTEMELIGSSSFQMKNGYIYPFNHRERAKHYVA